MPRPTLLTDELLQRIAALRAAGRSVDEIATLTAVSPRTIKRGMAVVKEKRIMALVDEAEGRDWATPQVHDGLVASIVRASTESWHAAAWLLERLWPAEFGPPQVRARVVVHTPRNDLWDKIDEARERNKGRARP
jgi:hypothetical protein